MADDDSTKELEDIAAAEEAALQEADDIFYKKWSGWAILGPFIPSVFCTIIIVFGSMVLSATQASGKVCKQQIALGLWGCVIISYVFLLVYSWVFLGDTITVVIPVFEKKVTLTRPFRSLKFLIFYYAVIGSVATIWMIVYSAIFSNGETAMCIYETPSLYFFSSFVLFVFWFGFTIVGLILVNKKFGGMILEQLNNMFKEPTPEEMEERVFNKKFAEYDKEKVGYIPNEELSQFINDLGIYMPDEELPDLISSLDPKQEGNIKMDALKEWFKKINAAAAPDEAAVITENKDKNA